MAIVTSDFACLIISKFDQCKCSAPSRLEKFGSWINTSRLTNDRTTAQALNSSAEKYLQQLQVSRTQEAAWNQLQRYVFEEAFTKFSDDEKIHCFIIVNASLGPRTQVPFMMRLLTFKVLSAVAAIFANSNTNVGRWITWTIIGWQLKKIGRVVSAYINISKYYDPNVINTLIHNVPSIAKVVSNYMGFMGHVNKRLLQYTIIFAGAVYCVDKVAPAYNAWIANIGHAVLLPTNWICDRVYCTFLQACFSPLQRRVEEVKNKLFTNEKVKAHGLWMHLLANPREL